MSFKFFIRADRHNTLFLRITNNRKKVEMSFGVQMTQEAFEDASTLKPKPQNTKWRQLLLKYQVKLDEIKCDLIMKEARKIL